MGAFDWLAQAQRGAAWEREYEVARKAAIEEANRAWDKQDRANQRRLADEARWRHQVEQAEIEARQPWVPGLGTLEIKGAASVGSGMLAVGGTGSILVGGTTTTTGSSHDYWVYDPITGRYGPVSGTSTGRDENVVIDLAAEEWQDDEEAERAWEDSPLFTDADIDTLHRFAGKSKPGTPVRAWLEDLALRVKLAKDRGYRLGGTDVTPVPAPATPDPLPVERREAKPLVLDVIDVSNLPD